MAYSFKSEILAKATFLEEENLVFFLVLIWQQAMWKCYLLVINTVQW